jgi:2,3-bisphosphoglycerate-independent phosphoglycerate mutase
MKSAEITDAVIENMEKYRFIRLNFPNGDIVGHTADIRATTIAIEAVDLCLARIAEEVDKLGGMMMVVADHGKAEELLEVDGSPKTAHTTNKIPCLFYDNTKNRELYELNDLPMSPSLEDVASTVAVLIGFNDYPEEWEEPLIKFKKV